MITKFFSYHKLLNPFILKVSLMLQSVIDDNIELKDVYLLNPKAYIYLLCSLV
ncbi:hypothetical protein LDVICp085 [lymphocystis disease virus-China]|uniref:Uncharacterized protein n=1 Tax=lymphocystis disease virus-China TaxID=256729 RepID=Q678C6_9VIRU|nr:hypothetical protein LDVICp085 [lymphocystis disease virus-China]AAU10931.1 hypothetical protein [lymphocystis disease virus-China]